jgi:hypothetical protein
MCLRLTADRSRNLRVNGQLVSVLAPASALITVSNFARPGILIEIQGVAVIAEK